MAALRCSLALLGLLVSASSAPAGPMTSVAAHPSEPRGPAKVAVLIVPLDSIAREQTARLESVTRRLIEHSARLEPLSMMEALDPVGIAKRESRQQDGDAALKLGVRAYNDLDTQKALFQLDRALRAYEQVDFSRGMESYIRAWTMKIASQVANGETKTATREVDRLLAVSPKAEFPPSFFPPDLIAHAEHARRAAVNGNSKIEIQTHPVSAEIYVDGQLRGMSPLTVSGLAAGEHFITARASGYSVQQERGREGSVDLALRPSEGLTRYAAASRRVAAQPKSAERDAAAVELGVALHADQVVLVIAAKSVAGSKLDVTLLRIATVDGHNWAYRTGTVSLGEALPAVWELFATPALTKDDPRSNGPVTHFDDGFTWSNRATGVTLLIAGVALLGTGVYCGLTAANLNNQYRSTPPSDPKSEQLRMSSQTFGVLTDVFVLAGLAAAAPGGYFTFLAGDNGKPKPSADLPMPPPPTLIQPARRPAAPAPVPAPAPAPVQSTPKAPPPAPSPSPGTPASPPPAVPTQTSRPAPATPTVPAPEPPKKPAKSDEDDLKNY